ncbi:hypothetical protein DP73_03995 [Desulfosporosinus sp. HMP52]|uniref:acyltransferase family protein n=1 Tax=Desulfosporosinus sp. HMP52 TaxID=1487923 RepID=UPI00051F978F|nr:DUF5009 domain-containing protein [Desulfosporosinus sp. HMP52]KGK91291.1 hypothetical protein DP73_03995 [Desulfosporosinus sp. HMP52]
MQKSLRMECIDIFRGLTIALMIMVSNPGNPSNIPQQLKHAPWNGVTVADLVFPFFIFIMGVVVPISTRNRLEKGTSRGAIIGHILSRSSLIFLLGLLLNGFPFFDLTVIRIPGVLQRIAVVYLVSALIYILLRSVFKKETLQINVQLLTSALLLILYYLLLKYVHVPGYERGVMDLQGNLVQYIDLKYLEGHLYTPNWDPEGILSTIPALSSGLIGVVAGMILQRPYRRLIRLSFLIGSGLLLLFSAELSNAFFPYNKNLWSSSFVLLTSGLGILLLAFLYLVTDILKRDRFLIPFKVIGASAIFIYFTSGLMGRSLWLIPIYDSISGKTMSFRIWFTERLISPWAHGLDSLYFSLSYVIFYMVILGFLHHRKIYIRL